MSYVDFIDRKRRHTQPAGLEIEEASVHPLLHQWQNDIVRWASRRGSAAIFADCGLGKTFMQLEWARLVADRALILAPLSVARQTVREANKIEMACTYVRHPDEITGDGVWITNYEMADRFDPAQFDAVVLDESSILKNNIGVTRNQLIAQWADTPYRLCCTATPAPNDVAELANHAEFLGVMSRTEVLAAFFVHDDDGWRVKGHARRAMFKWMAGWARAVRTPSDIGGSDEGYQLPPLTVSADVVEVEVSPEGQLFATELGGVGGRSRIRRLTLDARVEQASRIASKSGQWIVWCGLNDEASGVTRSVDGAVNVEGSQSPEAKAEALEAFQDGQIRVLVTKPAIAGFGMNFQNAHQMVFVGMSDSYEAYYQAIRRCWRFGQSSPVGVHVVVSEIEQQIVQNIQRKESEAAGMISELVAQMNHREPSS